MRIHPGLAAAGLLVGLGGTACSKKEAAPAKAADPTAPAAPSTAAPAAPIDAAGAATAPTPPPVVTPPAAGEERDPSATASVTARALTDADLDELEVPGARQQVIGWTDRYGTNAVVISRQEQGRGALLTATHARREGDGSWTTVRAFKEAVDACEFDLSLYAQIGDWSVTDLDGDGLGEATFAWSAGCRSDVSPLTHKVLVVEDGEKYVLRGQTIDASGAGGTFEADAGFAKAPAPFRAHAEQAWKATAKEPS
ncbi:MAG: hypothetical protein JNK64_13410 [Myxococcales bacterium]|nr:hypothetical protein [Myxococcales bacterium]